MPRNVKSLSTLSTFPLSAMREGGCVAQEQGRHHLGARARLRIAIDDLPHQKLDVDEVET